MKCMHKIQKVFTYQNLIKINSTSFFFVFTCDLNSQLNKQDSRKVIFEVLTQSKILKRLDFSYDFWAQFGVCDLKLKNQVGLCKTIAVNPKEYFEKYGDNNINKKHKGLKKDPSGISFESYADRIMSRILS